MGALVTRREEFDNAKKSCYARWETIKRREHETDERLYVVYSYGAHWPLYIYSEEANTWYGNGTRYSRPTTRRHSGHACPLRVEIRWLSVGEMERVATFGVVEVIKQMFRRAA
jgi:hypothetical protein